MDLDGEKALKGRPWALGFYSFVLGTITCPETGEFLALVALTFSTAPKKTVALV